MESAQHNNGEQVAQHSLPSQAVVSSFFFVFLNRIDLIIEINALSFLYD
jgi:hypothetical protein